MYIFLSVTLQKFGQHYTVSVERGRARDKDIAAQWGRDKKKKIKKDWKEKERMNEKVRKRVRRVMIVK